MRRIHNFLPTICLLMLCALPLFGQNRPLDPKLDSLFPEQSSGFVTDVAHLLKNPTALETTLRGFRDNDSLYINVVTLPTIGQRAVEDVAREIGRKWKVAYSGNNSGFVVLIAMAPTHKCRVEVARGSEGYVTDSRAAEACRNAAPLLHAGDFDGGLLAIVKTLDERHQGEAVTGGLKSHQSTPDSTPWGAILATLAALIGGVGIIGAVIARRRQKREEAEAAEIERARQAGVVARQKAWEADRPRREAAEAAERARQLALAAAEAERERLAVLAEKRRWDALSPAQQRAELAAKLAKAEQEADDRRRAEAAAAAAAVIAEAARQRRQREQADADEARRRDSYSSSSSSDSSSGSSSGGSGGFDGGGGGSDF